MPIVNPRIYYGNPNLKKGGTPVSYNQDKLIEYTKCSQDPLYFIKKYFKIVNLDKGLIQYTPYQFQENMIDLVNKERFSIIMTPRQQGKCLYAESFINIRNKRTGDLKKITVEDFYNLIKQQNEREENLPPM